MIVSKFFSEMPLPKVFVIGHNKCGTRSICKLFDDNSYKSLHWDSNRIANRIRRNFYLSQPLLSGIKDVNIYSDMESIMGDSSIEAHPFYAYRLFPLLDLQYPNSLFIYNYRVKNEWIRSRINHMSGRYLESCRMHLKALQGTNKAISNGEIIEWWNRSWETHESEIFSYFSGKQYFIKFDINSNESFISLKEFLSQAGYKMESDSLPLVGKS